MNPAKSGKVSSKKHAFSGISLLKICAISGKKLKPVTEKGSVTGFESIIYKSLNYLILVLKVHAF